MKDTSKKEQKTLTGAGMTLTIIKTEKNFEVIAGSNSFKILRNKVFKKLDEQGKKQWVKDTLPDLAWETDDFKFFYGALQYSFRRSNRAMRRRR